MNLYNTTDTNELLTSIVGEVPHQFALDEFKDGFNLVDDMESILSIFESLSSESYDMTIFEQVGWFSFNPTDAETLDLFSQHPVVTAFDYAGTTILIINPLTAINLELDDTYLAFYSASKFAELKRDGRFVERDDYITWDGEDYTNEVVKIVADVKVGNLDAYSAYLDLPWIAECIYPEQLGRTKEYYMETYKFAFSDELDSPTSEVKH